MPFSPGLYIVATPIGNLKDISIRALQCFRNMDAIACEDTRTTGYLLHHYHIKKPLFALHRHNEHCELNQLLERLRCGEKIAFTSDAGTPLIQDPGQYLVSACQREGIPVFSLPGACAAITALTLSGLDLRGFLFAGFLPSIGSARHKKIVELLQAPVPIVIYEAPHRIQNLLTELANFEKFDRSLILLRELTKKWESRYEGRAADLLQQIQQQTLLCKGEFVVIIAPPAAPSNIQLEEDLLKNYEPLLKILAQYKVPLTQASKVLAPLIGLSKKTLYASLLDILKKEAFESAS